MLMKPSRRQKAQSAMEYLMTYGWAILIIAVVLGALFSLGVFNGKNILGSACVAQSGFYCQNAVYYHGTVASAGTPSAGNVMVTLGQNTGQSWSSVNVVFVPQGTPVNAGLPGTTTTFVGLGGASGAWANSILTSTGLASGQQYNFLLPVNGTSNVISVGSSVAAGQIWAQYCLTGQLGVAGTGCTPQYIEIATLNQKAS